MVGGRRPRPHAVHPGDEILIHILDELEGIRDVLDRTFPAPPAAPAEPVEDAPAAGKPTADKQATDSVPVDIREPAASPTLPRKRAVKSAKPPARKES